jgi:DNA-binding NtrC family response regulator
MDKILIIDTDKEAREKVYSSLKDHEFYLALAENGEQGINLVEKEIPDLIITGLRMNSVGGLDILKKAKEIDASIPVIIMTAYNNMHSTLEAMQLGAYDYIDKPLDITKLELIIKRALESKKLSERLNAKICEENNEFNIENTLIGKSSALQEIFNKIGQISMNKVTILIQGESGTGKELVARIIHNSGITKDQPFIAVNCSALTETLHESELFGHVRGSFTGAIRDKKGKFELAGEGTIFLDEISEINQDLQVKLLRVFQEKEFEKVGGENSIPMNARIITATNRNLAKLVEEGTFREDLYYRLKVFSIELPPLRERKEDIADLVVHFLKKINRELHKNVRKIPYEVMEILQNYHWVGNVRELENILLQAVVLSKGDVLEKENIHHIKTDNNNINDNRIADTKNAKMSLAEIEKKHIKLVLDSVGWNKKKAYTILGITKPTLNAKIRDYGIDKPA